MEGVRFLVDVEDSLIFSIALPALNQFTDEKVYPYFAEKWDIGRKQKNRETCALKILKKSDIEREEKDKVIHLEEYSKRARA